MKKFISAFLSMMLFFSSAPRYEKVSAEGPSKGSCGESFWKACSIVEGIMLIASASYIWYQHHQKESKYNNFIKIRPSLSRREGDRTPIPIIDKILKYDIPRELNGEAAVCYGDVDCIFYLVFARRRAYTQTEAVIAADKRLSTYRATFDMVCDGEQEMTIRQFVDMLKDLREMY